MNKGQSSIIDALLFLLICASAATLMFYTAGLYGENTTKQLGIVYNFEFAKSAMLALHYAQDESGNFFWIELSKKLTDISTSGDTTSTVNYLTDSSSGAGKLIKTVLKKSPSSKTDIKITKGNTKIYCYISYNSVSCGTSSPGYTGTVFTSKTELKDLRGNTWNFYIELYY